MAMVAEVYRYFFLKLVDFLELSGVNGGKKNLAPTDDYYELAVVVVEPGYSDESRKNRLT